MKLELKFDETIYRKQMDLLFEMGYGREKTYFKNSNYFGFGLIILGVLAIIGKGNLGYAFVMFGLGLLIPYYSFHFKQKKLLRRLEEEQSQIITYYKENPNASFDFNENGLVYTDHYGSKKIDWQEFHSLLEKEENIFLITKDFTPYVFGKTEVGTENYNLAIDFIESKLGEKTSR